eukprot:TRINITY_DN5239_c0_g1_i3.p1 TRINITY_DN5239_c0_g1~~TRINITY_DN5239_c0_g1_i3.p1  ORF type:complete len:422 (+),score=85.17 TRINITY_DN5239_c0_g1_i3:1246-2511(+)
MSIRVINKAISRVLDLSSNTMELHEYLGVRVIQAHLEQGRNQTPKIGGVVGSGGGGSGGGGGGRSTDFYFATINLTKFKTPKWKTIPRPTGPMIDPSWNENFVIPIPEDVISEEAKFSDSLSLQVFSLVKGNEQMVAKGTANIYNLRKTESQILTVELKPAGKLDVEVWWFHDSRVLDTPIVTKGFKKSISCANSFFLPPPRDCIGKPVKKLEIRWFDSLSPIDQLSLKKGDILLQKTYYEQNLIKNSQKPFFVSRGTKFTTQVSIVCFDGGSEISYASANGMISISSKFPEGDYLVYRCLEPSYAQEAANWACDVAKNHNLKYSAKNCLGTIAITEYNANAKLRSKKLAAKELPTEMMCAEFVCAAYQCRPEDPKIKLDTLRVTPMLMEDHLNRHCEDFIFIGVIANAKRKKQASVTKSL